MRWRSSAHTHWVGRTVDGKIWRCLPDATHSFRWGWLSLFPLVGADGRSIVFSFRQNGATNIVIYDLGSKTMRKITSTRNRDFGAVYSADGRALYYSSNDDGTSRIWRVHADRMSRAEPLFWRRWPGSFPQPTVDGCICCTGDLNLPCLAETFWTEQRRNCFIFRAARLS